MKNSLKETICPDNLLLNPVLLFDKENVLFLQPLLISDYILSIRLLHLLLNFNLNKLFNTKNFLSEFW